VLDYEETIRFWDEVFSASTPASDVLEPLPYPELEHGLRWLCRGSRRVLDFGCGRGRLLFRCLGLGADEVLGIDISSRAIALAERIADRHRLSEKAGFLVGSTTSLEDIGDQAYDAAILSNVLDNLVPSDARTVLAEMERIIGPGGKLLVKLNDHYPAAALQAGGGVEEIDDDFYRESSGIFLWNLSDEAADELLGARFDIERTARVEFKEHEQWNRLYFLRNRR
jgi:SAM-dependent methyltransferase